MIRFSLRQLSYFVAAAETGSTLRAAETLHVSQPAVSMAISQLESVFGHKLFVRRHAQGIILTPFGRRKLGEVRHLMAQAEALAAKEGQIGLKGDLDIGVFSSVAPVMLPGILSQLHAAHPKINVRIRESNLDQLYRDLDTGVIELALLYDLGHGQMTSTVELGRFMPYVLLPEGHHLAAQDNVSLVDVAAEPYIIIDMPYSRDYFISLFRMAGCMPKNVINCASVETVRGMVAHGHGLSTLVTRPAGDISYDGKRLVCRPIREDVPPQRCIIAHPPRLQLTTIATAFVEICKSYVAGMNSGNGVSELAPASE